MDFLRQCSRVNIEPSQTVSPSGQALDFRLPLTHEASQVLLRFASALFHFLRVWCKHFDTTQNVTIFVSPSYFHGVSRVRRPERSRQLNVACVGLSPRVQHYSELLLYIAGAWRALSCREHTSRARNGQVLIPHLLSNLEHVQPFECRQHLTLLAAKRFFKRATAKERCQGETAIDKDGRAVQFTFTVRSVNQVAWQ